MNTNTPDNYTKEVAVMRMRTACFVVLEIYAEDIDKIHTLLQHKSQEGGDFLQQIPMVLDFTKFNEEITIQWLQELGSLLSRHNIMSAGIIGIPESFLKTALEHGITVWPSKKVSAIEPIKEEVSSQELSLQNNIPEQNECRPTKIIEQPVRSGQRIYAKGSDIIILSAVNAGAEVMADGNIHVYGTLRGRALAGVSGWEGARIFCQNLQADLIAIAGYYTTNEDLPDEKRNLAVRISLQEESLNIDPLVS